MFVAIEGLILGTPRLSTVVPKGSYSQSDSSAPKGDEVMVSRHHLAGRFSALDGKAGEVLLEWATHVFSRLQAFDKHEDIGRSVSDSVGNRGRHLFESLTRKRGDTRW